MDYQVFLVTRMREEYVHGRDARMAVAVGFGHGSRVVAAAAIIVISVFAGKLEQTRWNLVVAVPELQAAVISRSMPMAGLVADVIARRTGRSPDDLEVRSWVGALIGIVAAVFFGAVADSGRIDLDVFDQALAHLEAGLPL